MLVFTKTLHFKIINFRLYLIYFKFIWRPNGIASNRPRLSGIAFNRPRPPIADGLCDCWATAVRAEHFLQLCVTQISLKLCSRRCSTLGVRYISVSVQQIVLRLTTPVIFRRSTQCRFIRNHYKVHFHTVYAVSSKPATAAVCLVPVRSISYVPRGHNRPVPIARTM